MGMLTQAGDAELQVKAVRNQQTEVIRIIPNAYIVVDSAQDGQSFTKLPLPQASSRTVTTSHSISNEPLATLTDGRVEKIRVKTIWIDEVLVGVDK